ncbi:MAG: cation transporting ATPase C-terminal domain-containing protein [Thermoleophilia bacterium]|nr:cation transporting ATPase C-terminal domain-containing protein [Thermoleophilia bacterium]
MGALLLAGAFGLFELAQRTGHSLEEARTAAVNVFVFGEMFYLFSCRSLTRASFRLNLWSNRVLVGGVLLMLALQLLYTYLPGMNRLFGSSPLPLVTWGWILLAAFAVHVLVEIEKWIRRRRSEKTARKQAGAAC